MKTLLFILTSFFTNLALAQLLTEADFVIYDGGSLATGRYSIGSLDIKSSGGGLTSGSDFYGDIYNVAIPVTANSPNDYLSNGWISVNIYSRNGNRISKGCVTIPQTKFLANRNQNVNLNVTVPYNSDPSKTAVQAFVTAYYCDVFRPPYLFSNLVTQTLSKSNASNLDLSLDLNVTPSAVTANNAFSVKPGAETTIYVKISGENIPSNENGTADVTLKIGQKTLPIKSVSLAAIRDSGNIQVAFINTFTSDDAGSLNLIATVSAANDSNSGNNSIAKNIYVLCNVEDKGTLVPFYSQVDAAWASDHFGIVNNSNNPGTIQKYGCSLSAYAMLMQSYGIKNTPQGSPLNPSFLGMSIDGLKGESLNPKTLNQAFANYKTKYTGNASVALNNANDPIWPGMAEVARAGYRAMCSNPAYSCNPNDSKSAVSFKSIRSSGFDTSENSADNKKIMKEICEGNPVILKFKSKSTIGQHYMLATGLAVDDSGKVIYRLNNPARSDGENTFQNDENMASNYPYIMGYSLYHPSADPSMMLVTAPMNTHFVVTDSLGRKSGYDPIRNTLYDEIPGANYGDQVINTPEEDQAFEIMTAERYFISSEDTPAGKYTITAHSIESGNYYLDIRTTDADGFTNDANYKTGTLASGQSESISLNHTQASVPAVNAILNISHYIVNLKTNRFLDVGILLGGKIKSTTGTPVTLKDKFKLTIGGVNGYELSIPFSNFKATAILKEKVYTYISKGTTIVITESGNFEVVIYNSNLQNVSSDKSGYLRVDIDSLSGDANVNLKCIKNICTKYGK